MNTLASIILDSINKTDISSLTSSDFLKNIENYLYILIIINEINKLIAKNNNNVNLTDIITYINIPKEENIIDFPEDQLNIKLLAELGPILSSYGYALANNIPVSINKNFNRVNFLNSYGTLIALARKKSRSTENNNYLNSNDYNLPAVDSSNSIDKKIQNVVTGVTLR
jgi:hypothetical protein